MVEFATKRVAERGLSDRISTQQADAQALTALKVRCRELALQEAKGCACIGYQLDEDTDGQHPPPWQLFQPQRVTEPVAQERGQRCACVPSPTCSCLELFESLVNLVQRLLSCSLHK